MEYIDEFGLKTINENYKYQTQFLFVTKRYRHLRLLTKDGNGEISSINATEAMKTRDMLSCRFVTLWQP